MLAGVRRVRKLTIHHQWEAAKSLPWLAFVSYNDRMVTEVDLLYWIGTPSLSSRPSIGHRRLMRFRLPLKPEYEKIFIYCSFLPGIVSWTRNNKCYDKLHHTSHDWTIHCELTRLISIIIYSIYTSFRNIWRFVWFFDIIENILRLSKTINNSFEVLQG